MSLLSGKIVLITGGTGSFGNKFATFLMQYNPQKIIIYSRDEKKQYEMRKRFPDFDYIIGDIRDKERISYAMRGVNYVFHAAALKQVPNCEFFPYEAVKTNIIGSHNVCEAALYNNVESLIALSTDKAVKPINAMGISKSMMEKIVTSQNQYQNDTKFACVRYGNVMRSRGSVIPLFEELIKKGKKLTITVPNMTRFMMSLDDAVELVLHAFTHAQGGEVFVKKAPAVEIIDLAKAMLENMAGNSEKKIDIIGMRPGEKIDEVLVNEYEIQRAIENENFFKIMPEYQEFKEKVNYPLGYEYTSANTQRLKNYNDIIDLLEKSKNQPDEYT